MKKRIIWLLLAVCLMVAAVFALGVPVMAAEGSPDYVQTFKDLVNGPKLLALIALIFVDFVLGVILAIKAGAFAWSRLSNYLATDVLGLMGGYYVIGVAATFNPVLVPGLVASWAGIIASLLAMIITKGRKLGMPLDNS